MPRPCQRNLILAFPDSSRWYLREADITTQKQIVANRLNTLRSTGPITAEGKARVARNAAKQGLTAENVLIGKLFLATHRFVSAP
jgi:hypothetical protein